MPKKCGFTLAEVLITLGIIGVVAALTLPSLIMKQNEKQTVVKLKKMNSVLNQAYQMAVNEKGSPDTWYPNEVFKDNALILANAFKPYLNVIKDCGFEPGCLADKKVKYLDGTEHYDYNKSSEEYKLILSDGIVLVFYGTMNEFKDQGFYGNIKVDIDGFKGEILGERIFLYLI